MFILALGAYLSGGFWFAYLADHARYPELDDQPQIVIGWWLYTGCTGAVVHCALFLTDVIFAAVAAWFLTNGLRRIPVKEGAYDHRGIRKPD
jgi:hypothetical protein